ARIYLLDHVRMADGPEAGRDEKLEKQQGTDEKVRQMSETAAGRGEVHCVSSTNMEMHSNISSYITYSDYIFPIFFRSGNKNFDWLAREQTLQRLNSSSAQKGGSPASLCQRYDAAWANGERLVP